MLYLLPLWISAWKIARQGHTTTSLFPSRRGQVQAALPLTLSSQALTEICSSRTFIHHCLLCLVPSSSVLCYTRLELWLYCVLSPSQFIQEEERRIFFFIFIEPALRSEHLWYIPATAFGVYWDFVNKKDFGLKRNSPGFLLVVKLTLKGPGSPFP